MLLILDNCSSTHNIFTVIKNKRLPRGYRSLGFIKFNNNPVTLHGKADYIFVDIFDAIDFDLSKPNGRSIVTTLNGATPDYMQAIHEADKIEVYWK